MVKADPTIIFLVNLTKISVHNSSKAGVSIPVSQGPVAGYNTLWVDGGPRVFG